MKSSYIKPNSIFVSFMTEGTTCENNFVGSTGPTTDVEYGDGAADEFHRNIWEDEEEETTVLGL